ncbi:hypothetical protein PhCBS80983_g05039 [Powellomyces hirtus]|uniref:TIGR01456 family HAD hydrolase n=1 Tax=Powellomyces hirtus TaxID=109895 RepID=A0A507DWR7_9FUNG|nr:hypothetical protein PhCBS80983_g05039 [Powellomyces hirtus]
MLLHNQLLHLPQRTPLLLLSRCKSTTTSNAFKKPNLRPSLPPPPAFAFDMDGVLIRGGKAVPGARRAIERLCGDNPQNREMPFIVLTNSGGESEASKAAKLSKQLGIEIKGDQFIVSHTPMQALAQTALRSKLVHVVGPDAVKDVAKGYGFEKVVTTREIRAWDKRMWPYPVLGGDHDYHRHDPSFNLTTDPISAILIMHDPPDWGLDIQIITDLLLSQNGHISTRRPLHHASLPADHPPFIPLYSSNADFLWSNDYAFPRFGQGGFVAALRGVWAPLMRDQPNGADRELPIAGQFGKPSAATYDFAKRVLARNSSNTKDAIGTVYMVGDNPASDIAGANRHGWTGILVETGVYKQGDVVVGDERPEVVVRDVEKAVEWVMRREGWM